ncbi:Formylglycine-generating enzyme, required for sulfatase activity, contains SUMF1/FGE domain [Nonlabens sp. Hel1_33_55]|uniref:formylglycine-generating enzyme family protein n=1 Tax=Nonlabens sp. Hel1_33_55 TaxID=1336802 RepID=UPI000875AD16|nr:SUMF1/EgtB/PvdO family nonheme iron enzyme [Nonlabens sp. Hel1_33_55]SCX98500.1 Formylglycine-generating enzyme, required for sulfatase activity, contains SUMF1/FGE domain [Nonlabens sp. Hel1_33_55]
MKNSILTAIFTLLTFCICQSQEALAKIEFAAAEEDYQAGNYAKSLEHIETVKEMLGSTNSTVMYLEIVAQQKYFLTTIKEPVNLNYYISKKRNLEMINYYVENFADDVPSEKLKEIYDLQKRYQGHSIEFDNIIEAYKLILEQEFKQAKILYQKSCDAGNPFACKLEENVDNNKKAKELQDEVLNGIKNNMIPVEGGRFTMGGKIGLYKKEFQPLPTREVTVDDFLMSKYEVSMLQYFTIVREKPKGLTQKFYDSLTKDLASQYPIFQLTVSEIFNFIEELNKKTGLQYRLPTEAEWEYAAKGGAQSEGYKYSGSNRLKEVAKYLNNSGGYIKDFGSKIPNELGIYDMSGNAMEMCSDYYELGYHSQMATNNPTGPSSGTAHVIRGGHVTSENTDCLIINRNGVEDNGKHYSNLGIRLVLDTK